MNETNVPRILIAGNASGVGKSLIVTGLLMALRRRGLSVSCCVTGQSLQQGVIYSRLTQRHVRFLDQNLLSAGDIRCAVGQAGKGADLILIDGRDGFYDGRDPGRLDTADAELAVVTSSRVVLVIEAEQISNSLAAVVKGFSQFSERELIDGVIFNRWNGKGFFHLGDSRAARAAMQSSMKAYGLPSCDGCVPRVSLEGQLPPSDVFQRSNYTAIALRLLNEIEAIVSAHVDIDDILAIASTARPLEYEEPKAVAVHGECRIAVADDSCFNLCFQDNFDMLRLFGAQLVRFSPLADAELPKSIGGVYIPGACIGEYAELISANTPLYDSLREFYAKGGVVYSEGAGTAMLCNSFKPASAEQAYRGVGLLPLDVVESRQECSMFQATIKQDSVLGSIGSTVSGLSTGEWKAKNAMIGSSTELMKSLQLDFPGGAQVAEGFSPSAQSCSTLHFLHFGSNPTFAESLVEAGAAHQKTAHFSK